MKASVATTSIAPATTTTRPVQVASTTLPPTPVYKLNEIDGKTVRWSPCDGPISIWLNDSQSLLSPQVLTSIGEFLNDQAVQLSDITGHLVLYRGLTDETTSKDPKEAQEILIQISDGSGSGLDFGSTQQRFTAQSFATTLLQ